MYNPHLKTFFAVIETGSFSKAAEQLFLTPSAVLHQIRALESAVACTELYPSSEPLLLAMCVSSSRGLRCITTSVPSTAASLRPPGMGRAGASGAKRSSSWRSASGSTLALAWCYR